MYLDVIGFKEAVRSAKNNPSKIKNILTLLKRASEIASNLRKRDYLISGYNKPKINLFSDSIFLSYLNPTYLSITQMIITAALFQFMAIEEQHFLRGATVTGNHYEYRDIKFGPAIIKATEMESKSAIWPRVIVDPSVFNQVKPLSKAKIYSALLTTLPLSERENIIGHENEIINAFKNENEIQNTINESFKNYIQKSLIICGEDGQNYVKTILII